MLHLCREIPEVVADPEPAQQVVGVSDSARIGLAKVDVIDPPAFAVAREVGQVAIRDEIPVSKLRSPTNCPAGAYCAGTYALS